MASLVENGHFKNVQNGFPQNSFVKTLFKKQVVSIML